jgi:hypothetical protein
VRRRNKARSPRDWAESFLDAIGTGKTIEVACKAAKPRVSRATVYRRRNTDPAFAQALEDALQDAAAQRKEKARHRREMSRQVLSERFLMFLLRTRRPEVYG